MRCIAEPAFTGALTSFRAKVSHSWLDHEIAMVDTETAQRRWLAGGWAEVAQRWTVLYALAQRFAGHFDDFSAATLVDTLAPLQNLSRDDRNALKASLQQLHEPLIDTAALRVEYVQRLDALWRAVELFFALALAPARAGKDAQVASLTFRWQAVQRAAALLKEMFTSHRIPMGVLLP